MALAAGGSWSNPFGGGSNSGGGATGVKAPTSSFGSGGSSLFGGYQQRQQQAALGPSPLVAQFQNSLGFFQSQMAPQQAMLAGQAGDIGARIGLLNANYGTQQGLANQLYQNSLAGLGNQQQQLNVDLAAIPRQMGYYDALTGLAGQLAGIHTQGAEQDASKARRLLDSDATARGAYTAIGTNAGRGEIVSSLLNRKAEIGNQFEREQVSNAEQKARLGDRKQQLELQAKNFGIDAERLGIQLQQSLANMNLDNVMSVGGLMDMLTSNNINQQTMAQQIINQAMQYAPYMPKTTTSTTGSTAADAPSATRRGAQ